jgi:hypothetical protein
MFARSTIRRAVIVTLVLPSPASLVAAAGAHPVVVILLLLVVGVVFPAVWSRQLDRRCASAAVLAQLLAAATAMTTILPAVLTAYALRAHTR